MKNLLHACVTAVCLAMALSACGVSEGESVPTGDDQSLAADLSTSTRTYVALRRDTRTCSAPQCRGYWVHDVNRATLSEQYVRGLEFSSLQAVDQADVFEAKDGEVLLYGKLGPTDSHTGTRAFLVSDAWRGLPGVTVRSGDVFYKVAATTTAWKASKLNVTGSSTVDDFSVDTAAKAYVDHAWLINRIETRGALVAGVVTTAGVDDLVDASQVFIHLPDLTQACATPTVPSCSGSKKLAWARTVDRCLMPAACVTTTSCPSYVPACPTGYVLNSWAGGTHACTQYACDPAWLQ
jgi:hypothetical protein